MRQPPPDRTSRDEIALESLHSVVVEASAGTGKTTLLTRRVHNLIVEHGIPLENLAVVTFTKAAAAELRVRIRSSLPQDFPGLGSAWIDTIHGFASRVLREYPHLTGVCPDFRVETSHFSPLERRMLWDIHLAELAPGDARESMDALVKPGSEILRELSSELESVPWITDMKPFGESGEVLRTGWNELLTGLEAIAGRCSDPSDKLQLRITDALESLRHGGGFPAVNGIHLGAGSERNWGGAEEIRRARDELRCLRDMAGRLASVELFSRMVPVMEKVVIPCAGKARSLWAEHRARLSYDDLLQTACRAIHGNQALAAALSSRFRHVLIDEFQDTSMLQAGLFLGFLSDAGLDGRLTIVGDPKQSIYGWRNADVETYRETVDRVCRSGAVSRTISTNFRSCRALIEFVNAFGSRLFSEAPPEEEPFGSQYSPLLPAPEAPEGSRPVVMRLPDAPDGGSAADCKTRAQAEAIAGLLEGQNPGDWAVLFRSATRLDVLLEALEARGIPFLVEAGRDFKDRLEVRDTAMLIRAVMDPGDTWALAHALRSMYFGLDDPAITGALRGSPGREAREACELISSLRPAAQNLSPDLFLETIFKATCITEAVRRSGYEVNRRLSNLRSILERARDCPGIDLLLDVLHGTAGQAFEEPSGLPADGDSVTLSTIHRAKGLAWKNVILLYPGQGGGSRGKQLLEDQRTGRAAVKIGDLQSPHYFDLDAREKARAGAEFRRLLYVAVTRPMERLVIFSDSVRGREGPSSVLFDALEGAVGFFDQKILPPAGVESLHPRMTEGISGPRIPPVIPPAVPSLPEASARAKRLGSEVHGLLEKIDLAHPKEWLRMHFPGLRGEMEFPEEAARLAMSFFRAELPFDLAAARVVGREYPLLYRGKALYVDLLLDTGQRLEVVDFKTDGPDSLERLLPEYRTKLDLYAAILEKTMGRPVGRNLVLLQTGGCISWTDPSPPAAGGEGP
jgi:ATP-dependent helicase/nuclease subunit A